jgi:hypothetical protein
MCHGHIEIKKATGKQAIAKMALRARSLPIFSGNKALTLKL